MGARLYETRAECHDPYSVLFELYPRRVEFYTKDRAFKIDKARRDLGYQPKVGLDDGLRRTAEWYFANGYLQS